MRGEFSWLVSVEEAGADGASPRWRLEIRLYIHYDGFNEIHHREAISKVTFRKAKGDDLNLHTLFLS